MIATRMGFVLDTSTEFGARAERRLREETIAWLTTVGRSGAPHPNPVWFLWDRGSVLLYSQPGRPKLHNIERHPLVALSLETRDGADVVVLNGEAAVSDDPPPDRVEAYVAKYARLIEQEGWTPESMAAEYSVPVRVRPSRLRGF